MNAAAKQDLFEKTIKRIRRANITHGDYFISLIHQSAEVEGVESVFQRIVDRDDDMALDHLMEIKYGLVFKSLGFHLRFEPLGSKGPDLIVERNGVSAFVEVKRYRPKDREDIPEFWGPHGTLPLYGDPARAQERIAGDLLSKVRQIEPRDGVEHGILAIWSDREAFEDVEFQCAVRQISRDAAKTGLRFCVYGSDYVSAIQHQRFCCEPVGLLATFVSWIEDLEGAR